MTKSGRPIRIFYLTSAGDGAGSLTAWLEQRSFADETALTYTGAFFDLCEKLGAHFLVVTPSDNDRAVAAPAGRSINVPRWKRTGGINYHIGIGLMSLRILAMIARYRPDVAIISDRTVYWLAMAPARLLGARLVLSAHIRLRNAGPISSAWRAILATDRYFLRRHCAGALAVSTVVRDQLLALAAPRRLPVNVFRGLWRREGFDDITPADWGQKPFRILYIGRIEPSKGVFDLLDAFREMVEVDGIDATLEFCGDGGAMAEMRARVDALASSPHVTLHGHCRREQVLERLKACHTVVVPTRSEFPEGYNKVAVEAVLSRRPVVASRIIPAVADIGPAAIDVEPDDWRVYHDALRALATDEQLYRRKVAEAEKIREQFFDARHGWHAQALGLFEQLGLCGVGTSEPEGLTDEAGPSPRARP